MDPNTTQAVDPLKDIREKAFLLYWNEQYRELYFPNTIGLAFYLIIGVPGNIIIILIYQFRLRKEKDGRFFITPLAYLDLLALIITASLNLTRNLQQVMFPGSASCKMLLYLSYGSTCSSLFLLNVIAVQRFQKICKPFGRQMDNFWKKMSIGICVISSLLLYSPVPYFYGVIEIRKPELGNITGYQCNKLPGTADQLKGLSVFQSIAFFFTLSNVVAITILYVIITVAIVKQVKKTKIMKVRPEKSSGQSSDATILSDLSKKRTDNSQDAESSVVESSVVSVSQLEAKQRKPKDKSGSKGAAFRVSFMFMTISFVGFLAYLPSWTFILIETKNPLFWKTLSTTAFHICLTLRRMYMLNHVANPFIYGAFDVAFRQEIKKLFCVK